MAMLARRRPLLPSSLSLVTVTEVFRYFNVMLFSCRYQAHIADSQMVSYRHYKLLRSAVGMTHSLRSDL